MTEAFVKIDPVLRESLFAHEMFRRFGFSNDETYLMLGMSSPDGKGGGLHGVGVTLRAHGKEFNYYIGILGGVSALPNQDAVAQHLARSWTEAVEIWQKLPSDEAIRQYESSRVRREVVRIAMALMNRGFRLKTNAYN